MPGNSHLTSPLRKCDKVKWTWLWNGKAGRKGMEGRFTNTHPDSQRDLKANLKHSTE